MTATRIYLVTAKNGEIFYVWATSKSQARSHIARDDYKVSVAGQADLVNGMKAGATIQHASDYEHGKAIRAADLTS